MHQIGPIDYAIQVAFVLLANTLAMLLMLYVDLRWESRLNELLIKALHRIATREAQTSKARLDTIDSAVTLPAVVEQRERISTPLLRVEIATVVDSEEDECDQPGTDNTAQSKR
jgi:hypothetical protein